MALTADELVDRRTLKRRVTFWRLFALIAAILAIIGIAIASGAFSSFNDKNSDHIARVSISGVITNDRPLLKLLEKLKDQDQVKAVIINMSSPGGTTVGGEAIYEAVRNVSEKKPVVTSVEGMAASAGYMIASASDHIVARRSSIVGSIGVIFQYADVSNLLDKVGVSVNEIKSAPLKAEPSPFHPTSEEATAMIDRMIKDSYNWFVDLVSERRNMDRAKTLKLADGSVFTGTQGLANGLIDEIGGEETARKWLVSKKEIGDELKIILWKPERANANGLSLFGRFNISSWFLEKLGISNNTRTLQELRKTLPERLFLDGLISIVQH